MRNSRAPKGLSKFDVGAPRGAAKEAGLTRGRALRFSRLASHNRRKVQAGAGSFATAKVSAPLRL